MIHYHGGPINPGHAAAQVLRGRHAMVSFADPRQVVLVSVVCQSFAFDNGAYSAWTQGAAFDKEAYLEMVVDWHRHPAFDWALIPDVIEGSEAENDQLVSWWKGTAPVGIGVPVWHLHESIERLKKLAKHWPRIAIGSSAEFKEIGSQQWWARMAQAMHAVCVSGRPITRLHGLRMLDPKIFAEFPFSSADSTNVAKHVGNEGRWHSAYRPPTPAACGIVIADRIEAHQSASEWQELGMHEKLLFELEPCGDKEKSHDD